MENRKYRIIEKQYDGDLNEFIPQYKTGQMNGDKSFWINFSKWGNDSALICRTFKEAQSLVDEDKILYKRYEKTKYILQKEIIHNL